MRLIGLLEGTSFLLLLGVAMPLKYLAGQPEMVSVVGLIHGILFMAFVGALAQVAIPAGWSARWILGALIASVLPFGPFVLEARLRRDPDAPVREAARAPGIAGA
jgi:integral membrane protein